MPIDREPPSPESNDGHEAETFHERSRSGPSSARKPRPVLIRYHNASHLSPIGPALRANPSPEVTDLICRLPLPTLFYRLEAVHLGDLLRIWVRSDAKISCQPGIFKGQFECITRHRIRDVLRKQRSYRRMNRFQEVRSLERKENSP